MAIDCAKSSRPNPMAAMPLATSPARWWPPQSAHQLAMGSGDSTPHPPQAAMLLHTGAPPVSWPPPPRACSGPVPSKGCPSGLPRHPAPLGTPCCELAVPSVPFFVFGTAGGSAEQWLAPGMVQLPGFD